MNEKEVVAKMQNLIGRSNMAYTNSASQRSEDLIPVVNKTSEQNVWLESLPEIEDGCFLIDVNEDNLIIFCVKELDWQTAMNIDMKSFRVGEKDVDYYSEEYERRQTLSRAIVWVADFSSKLVVENKGGQILEQIKYDVLDIIWDKYKSITSITTQEAQKLYESTRKYLNGETQEGVPIPSIIPETIAICDGWCSLSSKELRSLTAGEWERMQIIKMARTDVMGVYTSQQVSAQTTQSITPEQKEPSGGFDFEAWSARFPSGHPNAPK